MLTIKEYVLLRCMTLHDLILFYYRQQNLYKLTGRDRQAGRQTGGLTDLDIGRHAPPKISNLLVFGEI